jgi:hypothetical protein
VAKDPAAAVCAGGRDSVRGAFDRVERQLFTGSGPHRERVVEVVAAYVAQGHDRILLLGVATGTAICNRESSSGGATVRRLQSKHLPGRPPFHQLTSRVVNRHGPPINCG